MKLFLNLLLAFLIIFIALPVALVFNTIDWMRARGDWLSWRNRSRLAQREQGGNPV